MAIDVTRGIIAPPAHSSASSTSRRIQVLPPSVDLNRSDGQVPTKMVFGFFSLISMSHICKPFISESISCQVSAPSAVRYRPFSVPAKTTEELSGSTAMARISASANIPLLARFHESPKSVLRQTL